MERLYGLIGQVCDHVSPKLVIVIGDPGSIGKRVIADDVHVGKRNDPSGAYLIFEDDGVQILIPGQDSERADVIEILNDTRHGK